MAGSRGDWLDVICPYLRAADGTWRSAVPAREHRCWAFEPVIELPGLTQQRLCLTQAHSGCERFLHAQERRAAALARDHIAPERVETARFGPFVSPVPLAVEHAASGGDGPRALPSGFGRDRLPFLLLGGAAIGILLVAAIIIFGGFLDKGTGIVLPTSSPTHAAATPGRPASPAPLTPAPTATAIPTPTATAVEQTPGPTPVGATPTPVVSAEPLPSSLPSASVPLPSETPIAGQRYRVKDGDKLPQLALKFGVTVRAIKQANDLGEPPVLVPGTFIVIPNPPASPPL